MMGAASVGFYFDEGELAVVGLQAALYYVVGSGVAASTASRGHADAANGVAADSGRDRAFVVLRPAVHEGAASFLDAASCELSCQFAMGCVVLCGYDQATRFFVQTSHDAGTQLAADLGERAEAVKQSVDQGG